jgi:hypothetical protein
MKRNLVACLQEGFGTLPSKIFLDTSVVNKVVEFGEYIFDNYLSDRELAAYNRRPASLHLGDNGG